GAAPRGRSSRPLLALPALLRHALVLAVGRAGAHAGELLAGGRAVDVLVERVQRRVGCRGGGLDGMLDLPVDALRDLPRRRVVEQAAFAEHALELLDRVALLPVGEFLGRAVALAGVGDGVAAEAVGDALQ